MTTRPIPYLPLSSLAEVRACVNLLYLSGLTHAGRTSDDSLANLSKRIPVNVYLDLKENKIFGEDDRILLLMYPQDRLSRVNSPAHFVSAVRAARRHNVV